MLTLGKRPDELLPVNGQGYRYYKVYIVPLQSILISPDLGATALRRGCTKISFALPLSQIRYQPSYTKAPVRITLTNDCHLF